MKALPFRMLQDTDEEIWRADTFWTKEPETLAWIEDFRAGDSLIDIGANVGVYSLYAASLGTHVLALEPHRGNFQSLALNCRQRNRHLPIRFQCAAVGAEVGMVEFGYDTVRSGTTGGGVTVDGACKNQVYCYTVDRLQNLWGPYDHIKIDVDGEETEILQGMRDSLYCRNFRSCLVEVSKTTRDFIVATFEDSGYTQNCRFNFQPNHSRVRRAEEGIDAENIIFVRDD